MKFSNTWFDNSAKGNWDGLFNLISPEKILEIGSYEGRSICYLIDKLGFKQDLQIHAVDSWAGGADHISKKIADEIKMADVEQRFDENILEAISKVPKKIEVLKHKKLSHQALAQLIVDGKENYFDFIYVDGSHSTSDTLCDMAQGYKLLKPGGCMAIDDYLWAVNTDPMFRPKLAIDAFINLHLPELELLMAPNTQAYFIKRAALVEK